ncbi:response regulator transcription factor [Cohnella thailandensis]|uniref:Response regulator transcription factor n=1 Tax=Cohnella thailandensis TaxID=557557 RepID=A0A841SSL1_9BACL|nr:AraC family transcriptional regulator [Cohnella thailandensis]MBB6634924.1 response regulator transcription factor [Cohnella thailandensis]MBP1975854.1 two-component system response regulator YesN [Cohnella thailandensis]
MYRLLIADDEALEREGLELIVRRQLPDTFEILHAENGRQAIELAEERRPHIVFMDVQMPGIQGIDALKEIRKTLPEAKFVLVTAYDSFAYAREAMPLGVREYIVKPAGREQIAALLSKLVDELEREKGLRAEQLELKNRVSTLQPIVENELALTLMVDQVLDADIGQLSEWLDFPLEDCRCIVTAFPGSPDSASAADRRSLFETIRRFAKSHGPCIVSSILEHHLAIFLRRPASNAGEWKEEAVRFAERLRETVRAQTGREPSVGIGSLRSGAEGLRNSYFEAVFASTFSSRDGEVCLFDDLKQGKTEGLPIGSSAEERGYVLSALIRIRELREEQTSSVIDRSKAYIRQRFAEELSLEDVANHVHLNPFYFSKVFKQHVGETFIDYLTGVRIDKAKQLIEEDRLSLKEVCYEVGYKDPNYFSRVFKKVTGVAPSEYRTRNI